MDDIDSGLIIQAIAAIGTALAAWAAFVAARETRKTSQGQLLVALMKMEKELQVASQCVALKLWLAQHHLQKTTPLQMDRLMHTAGIAAYLEIMRMLNNVGLMDRNVSAGLIGSVVGISTVDIILRNCAQDFNSETREFLESTCKSELREFRKQHGDPLEELTSGSTSPPTAS